MNTLDKLSVFFTEHWETHRGRIVGLFIGLLLSILLMTIGFLKTLLLIIFATIGYILGSKIDDKEDLLELLDRILPPRYRK